MVDLVQLNDEEDELYSVQKLITDTRSCSDK